MKTRDEMYPDKSHKMPKIFLHFVAKSKIRKSLETTILTWCRNSNIARSMFQVFPKISFDHVTFAHWIIFI